MNILEFFNYIYSTLSGFSVPDITAITEYYSSISHWGQMFNPSYFLGSLVYILVGWFVIQFTMILPVRVTKKLIKYPSKKGSEV